MKTKHVEKTKNNLALGKSFLVQELASRGSLEDKLASLHTILTNNVEKYNETLEQVFNLCSNKKRRETVLVAETILKIFRFIKNNINFENWKTTNNFQTKYIEILRTLLYDPIAEVRYKSIGLTWDFLKLSPENKNILIQLIISKFADSDNKVWSMANMAIQRHTNTRSNDLQPTINEICLLLTRTSSTDKTKYHCICFLNQINLSHSQDVLAQLLLKIYVNYFNSLNIDENNLNKMITALLTGITRTLPFVRNFDDVLQKSIDKITNSIKILSFQSAIRALTVLLQFKKYRLELSDTFFNTFMDFVLNRIKIGENHSMMLFFRLYYQVFHAYPDNKMALSQALLKLCAHEPPPFVCSSFVLLSNMYSKEKPFLPSSSMGWNDEDCDDDEGPKSSWVFTNLKISDPKTTPKSLTGFKLPWEICLFNNSYHDSIRPFSRDFLNGELNYDGDPLIDFSHTSFMDRFIQREPKAKRMTTCSHPSSTSNIQQDLRKTYEKCKISSMKMINKKRKKNKNISDSEDSDNDSSE